MNGVAKHATCRGGTMSSANNPSSVLDQHGIPFAGDSAAVAVYDEGVDRLLRFNSDVLKSAFALANDHPEAAMGNALVAYLHLTSTDTADLAGARDAWTAMGSNPMGDREIGHHRAIGAWLDGDWRGAAEALDSVLWRWPGDLLALQIGHQLDFFLGDAGNLRDRPGRSLPELDPDHPHTAFVRGMQAFGLEESGHYGESEATGLAAVEVNPDDVWAIHAVVHTLEMQGRVDEGIAFLLPVATTGAAATSSPCTTGGISRSICSKRVTSPARSRSTTRTSTTMHPTAFPSR